MEHLDNFCNRNDSWLFFWQKIKDICHVNLLILSVLVALFNDMYIDESVYIFSPDTYLHQRQQLYQDEILQVIIHSIDGRDQMSGKHSLIQTLC